MRNTLSDGVGVTPRCAANTVSAHEEAFAGPARRDDSPHAPSRRSQLPAEELFIRLGMDRFVPCDRRPLLTRLADMADATINRWKAADTHPEPGLYYLALTADKGGLEVRRKAPQEGLRYGEVLVALIR